MSATFIWVLFLASTLFQPIGSLLYFVAAGNAATVHLVYAITKVVMIAAPIVLFSLGLNLPRFTLQRAWKSSLVIGLSSGILFFLIILGTYGLFEATIQQYSVNILAKIQDVGIANWYWVAAILISLLHSLFEEYYWRWYVVRGFETRFSPLLATFFGNGLFALHHYIILSQFFPWSLTLMFGTIVGAVGCLWSWMYRKTGSLLAPWLSHALADASIFVVGYSILIAQ